MLNARTAKPATVSLFAPSLSSRIIAIMLSIVLCMSQLGIPFFAYAAEGESSQFVTGEAIVNEEGQVADDEGQPVGDGDFDNEASVGDESSVDAQDDVVATSVDEAASTALLPAADSTTKQFAPITRDVTANAANLVLIVELTDSSSDSFYNQPYAYYDPAVENPESLAAKCRTNLDYFYQGLNASPTSAIPQSYRSYMDVISKGKFKVASYIPQAYEDGTILRIRVSMSSSKVENNGTNFNSASLVTEAIAQLKAARPDLDASAFDANGDGVIDNVLVVVDLPADVSVTSHASTYGGDVKLGIAGKEKLVRAYTVLNGGPSSAVGISKFNSSIAVHERLHTLGARDYYRRGVGKEDKEIKKSGNPVGMWDVMAQGGGYAWPLAFTRQQVGWITIPELNLTGTSKTITLYAPADSDDNSSSKPQSYVIKLPTSSSEYFVIEYRKKGRYLSYDEQKANPLDTTPLYDKRIGASGLIVYRVNESLANEGNIGGKDYVYVFRPGETDLTSSAGDIKRAPIATGSYTTQDGVTLNSSIGSLDAGAQISDGAICYADGRNSGLKITAKSQTDNSITVTVELSSSVTDNPWTPVVSKDGTSPFSGYGSLAPRVASDGTNLFVLAENPSSSSGGNKWAVYKHDGSNWTQLGSANNSMKNVDIAWFNGSLYALGTTTSGSSTQLARCNGSSWVNVTSISLGDTNSRSRLSAIGGKLYALVYAYGKVSVYDCSTGSAILCGQQLSIGDGFSPILADVGGKPAIVAGTSSRKTTLYMLSGSSWKETSTLLGSTASILSSAKIGDTTYVYACVSGLPSKSYLCSVDKNGSLIKSTELPQLDNFAYGGSLTSDGTDLYLSAASSSYGTIVYKLPSGQANGMVSLEAKAYSAGGDLESIVVGKKLYVAISDAAGKTIAMRAHAASQETSTPTTPGTSTVSISFDANGGSGAPAKISGNAGASITSAWPAATPTRSGYVFAGWYTDKADGKGTKVTAFPAKFPNANVTYYAHWTKTQSSSSGNTNSSDNSGSSSSSGSSSASVPTQAPSVSGTWVRSGNRWWFQYDSATKASQKKSWPANEWVSIGGKRYHFDGNGWMHVGWQKLGGSWYYLGGTHDGAMKTGWQKVGGKWYYHASDGKMQTGWVDNGRYYCNGSGAMLTGWQKISNVWYYFNGSGAKTTGWQRVGGKWYYMASDGKMQTGWVDGSRYYCNSSGAMLTGWQKLGNSWYYFNGSGMKQTYKWIGGKYWVGSDGVMATNSWVDNNRYYVNGSGVWVPNARR